MTDPRWAVVLAGGVGSRFWPLSTPDRPKQLLPLISAAPMLRDTLDRLAPVADAAHTLGLFRDCGMVALLVVSLVRFPPAPVKKKGASGGRSLAEIMRQPTFIVATAASALGDRKSTRLNSSH